MIETPRIIEFEAAPTAVIRLRIPREQMPQVFGPAIEEIMKTLADQGISPAGAVFAHHFAMEQGVFDFEVGVPVAKPIIAAGRVEPGARPGARVAQTVYHGAYNGLPEAWAQFHGWIEEHDIAYSPDIWECYVDGPHSTQDESKYRTELNRPLVEGARSGGR